MILTLACGPYFSETGMLLGLALLGVVKPFLYWFFLLAFRYRVSTDRPLSSRRVVKFAAIRAGVGLGVLLGAWLLLGLLNLAAAWIFLVAERFMVWTMIGWHLPLKGRRLFGFICSGAGIDIFMDINVALGGIFGASSVPLGAWGGIAVLLLIEFGAIGAFLYPLYSIGRRRSLRARFFAKDVCRSCGYDLTGNTTGVCPECGTAIKAARPSLSVRANGCVGSFALIAFAVGK